MKIITYLIISTLLFLNSCSIINEQPRQYVLVVSLDGFRWDYTDKANTPTLDSIAKAGVKAKALIPSFPTKTFPNHYSIATGLYPDNHGIVLNNFYAPDLDKYYKIKNRESVENPEFYKGEPIWVTAEKQGVTTASFFWVGSEAPVKGVQPTYRKKYDHFFPFEQRIDTVIKWFKLPHKNRPHLVMLYFHEPDHIGHKFGPDSDTLVKTVESLDKLMGILSNKLNQFDIADSLNLIILSDHGMSNFNEVVYLEDHIDTGWFEHIEGWNPNFLFEARPEYYDTAFKVLSNIPDIKIWKHGELPKRLHYGNNIRTLDFITLANENTGLMLSRGNRINVAAHGYDNSNSDMHAIFYASGPAFKKGFLCDTIKNVNIYPLISEILQIFPAKTDGSIENIEHILK